MHGAAEAADGTRDQGETEARAALASTVAGLEDAGADLGRHPRPVVLDGQREPAAARVRAQGDGAVLGDLHRVQRQVPDDPEELAPLGHLAFTGAGLDHDPRSARARRRLQQPGDVLEDLRGVGAAVVGGAQQVSSGPARGRRRSLQALQRLVGEGLGVLPKHADPTDDGAQGVAQLVADGACQIVVWRDRLAVRPLVLGRLHDQHPALLRPEPTSSAPVSAGELGAVHRGRDGVAGEVGENRRQVIERAGGSLSEDLPGTIIHPEAGFALRQPRPSGAVGQPLEFVE